MVRGDRPRQPHKSSDIPEDTFLHEIPIEDDDKTVKIVLGSIAAAGLLGGIYALARHRLEKAKEE